MKTIVFALHGFLGEPADWKGVFAQVKKEKPDWELQAVDFMHEKNLKPDFDFSQWSDHFIEWVEGFGEARRILVGYSMGGRLALHALEKKPELWSSAVFLSTGPGLTTERERVLRVEHDQSWANKFLKEEFNQVMTEWNSQSIFTGTFTPSRHATKLIPEDLAKCLTNWSLAKQKDFRPILDFFHIPQIWCAGARDEKYSEFLKTLPAIPKLQKWEVVDAGHRLIFEAPLEVAHFIIRSLGTKDLIVEK
jgi:2-succinyl-6-hydroxy-2,4-cyclohexadiene-1-carboxylate synthase